MDNKIIKKISLKYENLFKTNENKNTFYAVNDALIYSFFCNKYKVQNDNYEKSRNDIEKTLSGNVFFYRDLTDVNYLEKFDESVCTFYPLFENINDSGVLEDILGKVLERHINQRDTGSYYTPKDTTRYMTCNAILYALLNKLKGEKLLKKKCLNESIDLLNDTRDPYDKFKTLVNNFKDEEKAILKKMIKELRIIEPTCGSGAFVAEIFEFLDFALVLLGETADYCKIANCVFGVDIEPEAIALTKLRIIIKASNTKVRMNEFIKIIDKHFIVADALKGSDYVINEESGFDWKTFGDKFDCAIGNPPYVESKEISDNFTTKNCGNLYAYVIERTCNIVKDNGVISFIVPLSFVSTPRMLPAKKYLESNSVNVFYSTYADRPGCIFSGVHQRLTIFFAEMGNGELKKYTSSYKFWYNEERENLFDNIKYYENKYIDFYKIGNRKDKNIISKLTTGNKCILDFISNDVSDYPIYMSTRIGFWTKAFSTNVFTSKEYKELFAKSKNEKYIILALLNSSIFYYFWLLSSDCWHVTDKTLKDIKIKENNINKINISKITNLVNELMQELEKNKKYIGTKQTDYEYKHKLSKTTIDKLDNELFKLFDLLDEEIEYIIHYTEKYRVNNNEK